MSAWIETCRRAPSSKTPASRTLMSAWIETGASPSAGQKPNSRTLMSAWIETRYHVKITDDNIVALS